MPGTHSRLIADIFHYALLMITKAAARRINQPTDPIKCRLFHRQKNIFEKDITTYIPFKRDFKRHKIKT